MPRKPIGETAMTDAERQARYRAARTAGVPIVRNRRPADHRGRARRWIDHVTGLVKEQVEFMSWLDSLPENLQDSATAEALDGTAPPSGVRSGDLRSWRAGVSF